GFYWQLTMFAATLAFVGWLLRQVDISRKLRMGYQIPIAFGAVVSSWITLQWLRPIAMGAGAMASRLALPTTSIGFRTLAISTLTSSITHFTRLALRSCSPRHYSSKCMVQPSGARRNGPASRCITSTCSGAASRPAIASAKSASIAFSSGWAPRPCCSPISAFSCPAPLCTTGMVSGGSGTGCRFGISVSSGFLFAWPWRGGRGRGRREPEEIDLEALERRGRDLETSFGVDSSTKVGWIEKLLGNGQIGPFFLGIWGVIGLAAFAVPVFIVLIEYMYKVDWNIILFAREFWNLSLDPPVSEFWSGVCAPGTMAAPTWLRQGSCTSACWRGLCASTRGRGRPALERNWPGGLRRRSRCTLSSISFAPC
ncbi:MAG: hypothetical protein HC828_14355, partial [Blastochloris sp.]|nr:hypothetical protein [Blastochloris sp.]